jgi:PHP family Zn ribbon phosphoesterase
VHEYARQGYLPQRQCCCKTFVAIETGVDIIGTGGITNPAWLIVAERIKRDAEGENGNGSIIRRLRDTEAERGVSGFGGA